MTTSNFTDLSEIDDEPVVELIASKEILSITMAELFTSEQCASIRSTFIDELWMKTKVVGDQDLHQGERQKLRGELSGFPFDPIREITKEANDKIFDFVLLGIIDQDYPQVFKYTANNYYNWHVEINPLATTRKLSFIVNLSDKGEYTGGEIEFLNTSIEDTLVDTQGSIIIFPSFLPYQIKPILTGERTIIIGHIHGPIFR
jgi:predicted 2-oxoglutarate/Fe(II)-dependent dioxygenase YbiX